MLSIQLILGTASICLLLIVFELIRRRKLREKYALLWLLSGLVLLFFTFFPNLLIVIADTLGIYYLTALFIISFLFLLLIVLHYSTVISQLFEKTKELTQELGILEFEFRELEGRLHKHCDKDE